MEQHYKLAITAIALHHPPTKILFIRVLVHWHRLTKVSHLSYTISSVFDSSFSSFFHHSHSANKTKPEMRTLAWMPEWKHSQQSLNKTLASNRRAFSCTLWLHARSFVIESVRRLPGSEIAGNGRFSTVSYSIPLAIACESHAFTLALSATRV